MKRPESVEFPEYFNKYINLIVGDNILKVMEDQIIDFQELISSFTEENEDFVYAPAKWTPKEVIGHIIDTERIMAYRALCFARKDKTPLPGYDDMEYVKNARFNSRTLYDLAHEFAVVRESNLALFKRLDKEALDEVGVANGKSISVRATLFFIAGHTLHHINVIRAKYLIP